MLCEGLPLLLLIQLIDLAPDGCAIFESIGQVAMNAHAERLSLEIHLNTLAVRLSLRPDLVVYSDLAHAVGAFFRGDVF